LWAGVRAASLSPTRAGGLVLRTRGGDAMAEHAEGSSGPRDALVSVAFPCIECGYALLGLPKSGICPECGTSVASSISSLHERTREALENERRGATMVQFGLVAYVLAVILMIAVTMVFMWQWVWQNAPSGFPMSPMSMQQTTPTWFTSLPMIIPLIPMLVVARGYWRLGKPESDEPRDETGGSRDLLRVSAWVLACCMVLDFLARIGMSVITSIGSSGPLDLTVGILSVISMVLSLGSLVGFAIAFFASLNLIIRLGERGLARDMVMRTRRDLVLVPLVSVLGSCVYLGPIIGLILYYGRLDQFRRMLSGALRVQRDLAGEQ